MLKKLYVDAWFDRASSAEVVREALRAQYVWVVTPSPERLRLPVFGWELKLADKSGLRQYCAAVLDYGATVSATIESDLHRSTVELRPDHLHALADDLDLFSTPTILHLLQSHAMRNGQLYRMADSARKHAVMEDALISSMDSAIQTAAQAVNDLVTWGGRLAWRRNDALREIRRLKKLTRMRRAV